MSKIPHHNNKSNKKLDNQPSENFRSGVKSYIYKRIPVNLIQNREISPSALVFLLYCLSLPDDWNFNTQHLANHFKTHIKTIRRWIKELMDLNYIHREEIRNSLGQISQFNYYFFDEPQESFDSKSTNHSNYRQTPSNKTVHPGEHFCSSGPGEQKCSPYIDNKEYNNNLDNLYADVDNFLEKSSHTPPPKKSKFQNSFESKSSKVERDAGPCALSNVMSTMLDSLSTPKKEEIDLATVSSPYDTGYLGGGNFNHDKNLCRELHEAVNRGAGRNFDYNSMNRIIKSLAAKRIVEGQRTVFSNMEAAKNYLVKMFKHEGRKERDIRDNLNWAPNNLISFWKKEGVI